MGTTLFTHQKTNEVALKRPALLEKLHYFCEISKAQSHSHTMCSRSTKTTHQYYFRIRKVKKTTIKLITTMLVEVVVKATSHFLYFRCQLPEPSPVWKIQKWSKILALVLKTCEYDVRSFKKSLDSIEGSLEELQPKHVPWHFAQQFALNMQGNLGT